MLTTILPAAPIAGIQRLIMATKHDAVPEDIDAQWVVDCDLVILGANQMRFDLYEQQIRQEYAHVADSDFRAGRSRILREFLQRPFIYNTPSMREQLETQARENLTRSLTALAHQ